MLSQVGLNVLHIGSLDQLYYMRLNVLNSVSNDVMIDVMMDDVMIVNEDHVLMMEC